MRYKNVGLLFKKKVFFRANRRLKNILQFSTSTVQTMYRLPPSFPTRLKQSHETVDCWNWIVNNQLNLKIFLSFSFCIATCQEPSGHSRTGHTGHMARLASKLARLANRLPGTNVPGWNFGWPTPKFPDARPTLLIFRLIFPRLFFPRFSLASGSVAYSVVALVGRWATLPESRCSSPHLASRAARKSMKSLCSFRMRSTSTMFRCEKEVCTRGKLNALEFGQRLFADRETRAGVPASK